MSDSRITIAPKVATYIAKDEKAKEILEWLVSKDIVKPEVTDCTLSESGGYAISNGAKDIVKEPEYLPFGLVTNGLEIVTERRAFHTGENFVDEIVCPTCKTDVTAEDWDLGPWAEGITDGMTCPLCGNQSEIHHYTFEPEWGFSDLGFIFWNWPEFKDEFMKEFQEKLDSVCNTVYSRI